MPITIITGPPGAGKTTIASALAATKPRGVHLVTDFFYHWIVSGAIPPWKPEANTQNTAVVNAISASAVCYSDAGYDVMVDGIIGPWFLDRFLAGAQHISGSLGYIVLRPARGVALRRATERTGEHALVDPTPVGLMYNAFENLGPFEANVIDTSDQDPATTVTHIENGLAAGAFHLPRPHGSRLYHES